MTVIRARRLTHKAQQIRNGPRADHTVASTRQISGASVALFARYVFKKAHRSNYAGGADLAPALKPGYRFSPRKPARSSANRFSAAGDNGPFSTAARLASNSAIVAMPTRIVPIAGCVIAKRVAASARVDA